MTKAHTKSKALKPEVGGRRKPKRQPKISRGPYGLSIPEAGAMIGLSRAASYQAARNQQMPVVKIGALMIVPRHEWLKKIGVTDAA
jgi:hypothetical protein